MSGTDDKCPASKEESSRQIGQIREGFLEEAEIDSLVPLDTGNSSWLYSDPAKFKGV